VKVDWHGVAGIRVVVAVHLAGETDGDLGGLVFCSRGKV
jgi:hypothetical protein